MYDDWLAAAVVSYAGGKHPCGACKPLLLAGFLHMLSSPHISPLQVVSWGEISADLLQMITARLSARDCWNMRLLSRAWASAFQKTSLTARTSTTSDSVCETLRTLSQLALEAKYPHLLFSLDTIEIHQPQSCRGLLMQIKDLVNLLSSFLYGLTKRHSRSVFENGT